jgi:hypothetical protein
MEFMNEKDLRDCFAMMLTVGFAMKGEINPKAIWEIADMLVEARKENDGEELGIAAVKPKRRYPKRPSDL